MSERMNGFVYGTLFGINGTVAVIALINHWWLGVATNLVACLLHCHFAGRRRV